MADDDPLNPIRIEHLIAMSASVVGALGLAPHVQLAARMQAVKLRIGDEAVSRLIELSQTTALPFSRWLDIWDNVEGDRSRFEAAVPLAVQRWAMARYSEWEW